MIGLTLGLLGVICPMASAPKHIVLLAGDEEYRSEEMLPQLAKILTKHHGFRCTVSYSINERGEIDPNDQIRQTNLEALTTADLCIVMLRFRQWNEADMKRFSDYYLAGKPFLAIRTSTHAFNFPKDSSNPYKQFGWTSSEWPGGFGKQVFGETWVSHWGNHGVEATRGHSVTKHPILSGVGKLFGTTDVYEAAPPADAKILVRGEVLATLKPDSSPATGEKKTVQGVSQGINSPMMPIVWVREPKNSAGKTNRVVTTTMGAATDLLDPQFRRLLVNSSYWLLNQRVPKNANVELVGDYRPTPFGFNAFKRGKKPAPID